jgi:hypothetical protein
MTDQPAVMQGARHGPTVAGASEEMSEASAEPQRPPGIMFAQASAAGGSRMQAPQPLPSSVPIERVFEEQEESLGAC